MLIQHYPLVCFSSILNALITLFQIFTLDQWFAVYKDVKTVSNYLFAIFYIILWILIGSFIFNNIFVGIMGEYIFVGIMDEYIFVGIMGEYIFVGIMGEYIFVGIMGEYIFVGIMGEYIFVGIMGEDIFMGIMGEDISADNLQMEMNDCHHLCEHATICTREGGLVGGYWGCTLYHSRNF